MTTKDIILSEDGKTLLGFKGYGNKLLIPDGVEIIGEELAFKKPRNIKNVILPNSVRIIRARAFAACHFLERITFNEGLIEIGDYAFAGANLKSIKMPSSLLKIGTGAFKASFSTLKQVSLNMGLVEIGDMSFMGHNIQRIQIPDTVQRIGKKAFAYNPIEKVRLPKMSIDIAQDAFAGCFAAPFQILCNYGGVQNLCKIDFIIDKEDIEDFGCDHLIERIFMMIQSKVELSHVSILGADMDRIDFTTENIVEKGCNRETHTIRLWPDYDEEEDCSSLSFVLFQMRWEQDGSGSGNRIAEFGPFQNKPKSHHNQTYH